MITGGTPSYWDDHRTGPCGMASWGTLPSAIILGILDITASHHRKSITTLSVGNSFLLVTHLRPIFTQRTHIMVSFLSLDYFVISMSNLTHTFIPSLVPLSPRTTQSTECDLGTSAISPLLHLERWFKRSTNRCIYDSMISKLATHGQDWNEALWILQHGSEDSKIVGVSINIEFLWTLQVKSSQGGVKTSSIKVTPVGIFIECKYLQAETRNMM